MGKPSIPSAPPAVSAPPPIRSDAADISQTAEIAKRKKKKAKGRADTFLPDSSNAAGYSNNNTFLSGQ